jgi:hypothetical protein
MTSIAKPSSPERHALLLAGRVSFAPDFADLPNQQGQTTPQGEVLTKKSHLVARAEWILGTLLTAVIVSLLLVRAFHAGGLWRDECAVVQLARMPSVSDILRNFQHEAFPPLFPLLVRAYTTLFGSSDTVLRILGLCVGCLLVGAFWINSRLLRTGVPLVGLGLLSLNTTFLVWGTTIRGYGLGSALIVLTFGCLGSLLLKSNPKRAVVATLVCLLGVQILLYNTILLMGIGVSVAIAFLFQRRFKCVLLILTICGLAAFSLLSYVPAYSRARDWNILVRGTPTFYTLWRHFEVALGSLAYCVPTLWFLIAVGLAGLLIFRTYKAQTDRSIPQRELICFAITACVLSIVGYYTFLRVLSYATSEWYYLALICVLAAAFDLMASLLCAATWLRFTRLGFGLMALIAAPFADWSAITERQTTIDVVAQTVAARAAPSDLIVVVPWQFGVPFQRYYRGTAPWLTIPSIADHQVHRYDLMKAKMVSTHPIDDLVTAFRTTLGSGNRVWFVGGLNLPPPQEGPMVLPPAPASRFKWDNRPYTASWWQQLSIFAIQHASKVDWVDLTPGESIRTNYLEDVPLTVVQGLD